MEANRTASIAGKKIVRYGELGREGTRSFLVKEWNRQSRDYFGVFPKNRSDKCLS